MRIEYEATFPDIKKDEIRGRLKRVGAVLVRPEFLQTRVTFDLPIGHEIAGGWLRVRDEGDKITMTLKVVDGKMIENQRETSLIVDDFSEAVEFLSAIGCRRKSYQETNREIWKLDDVDIMIDEWPFLEPFVEIEGGTEAAVKTVSEKLGFQYANALFCQVATLYNRKYKVPEKICCNDIPKITFEGENPFVKL